MPLPYKLGRKPRRYNPAIPHWSALAMGRPQIAYPSQHFWDAKIPRDFGMMINGADPAEPNFPNGLGDCVCAAVYHYRQVSTFNANPPEDTQPNSSVVALYEAGCGFNPTDPTTDQGCVIQDVLTRWLQQGIPLANGSSDKLLAFIEIDPRNLVDVREAIYECGAIIVGFNMPAYIMSGSSIPNTWGIEAGADTSIIGSHCVCMPSYYSNGQFGFITWGMYRRMTSGFWLSYVDECYAVADPSWIEGTGRTPLGLTQAQLEAVMNAL